MKSLVEITNEAVQEIGNIEFDLTNYVINEESRNYMFSTPYFKCLSAYCKVNDIKHVLELGTCTGASAIAMAQYAEKVSTFDVTLDDVDESLGVANINYKLLETPESCLELDLDPYDLIFIDIDHSGSMELRLHAKLVEEYKGIVFYDDIFFSPEMSSFWESIDCEKESLMWHFTGFGIVRY